MCKTTVLFEDIVTKYHPVFQDKNIARLVKKHPAIFSIEHLIELTMAEVGGYDFVDAAHCDFSDGTECKTSSVSPNPVKNGHSSYRLEISNVVSPGGSMKTGDVRCVVYNPHTKDASYFYIPVGDLADVGINYHPTTGIGRIFATWNCKTNKIPKLEKYRVSDFTTLAQM